MYTGPHIITNGLVLALDAGNNKSYPGSGTSWIDNSGIGNNGTLINGPTFNSTNGGSLVFDGVNDYITLVNNGSIDFGTGINIEFTIEIGFKLSNLTTPRVLIANRSVDSSPNTDYMIFYDNVSNNFYWGTGTSADSGAWWAVKSAFPNNSININTTYHISATLKATGTTTGNKSFFCNGNIINTTYTQKAAKTFTPVHIGKSNVSNLFPFNGNISYLRIYNKSLTSQEIQQNYNSTKTRYGL
jgi:hypothetical protein